MVQLVVFIFDKLEHIIGKGEIASQQHFLPFLQYFLNS